MWRMTQISKLKLAANAPAIVPRLVEVGTGIPLNSESPSHGLTFNPQLTVGAAGRAASGRLRRTPAVRVQESQAGPQPGLARDFAGLAQLARRSWAT